MNLYEYLDCNVFVGLKNLNDGFDAGSIKYFSAEEFETVLRRVEGLEVEIVGLEPWSANGFYDVKCQADYEGELGDETLWYWRAFADFNPHISPE